MMMHFMNGILIFPLIYSYILFSRFPGTPVVKGVLWGIALWMTAQLIVMPMIGAGIFGLKMGGMMSAMASLAGHVIYGALLGSIGGHAQPVKIEQPANA